MKMQKLAILFLAGSLMLPMAFLDVAARPTVINVNFTGQSDEGEYITLQIHGLGFPGEELEWEGTLVIPADQDTQPSSVSSIVMTEAGYSSTVVSGSFVLADSTIPDFNGCSYEFTALASGIIYIDYEYQGYCPEIELLWGATATVVINM